ncbi:MAG: hypothetical protein IKB16_06250 [Lentisphaeria bacterium]|nr:hypothetical protein [Lentisphaeria bacterium]
MNLIVQNFKRLLSGVVIGSAFFCAWTQDLTADTFPTVPRELSSAGLSPAEQKKIDNLLDFSKNFSIRMLQPGKATPTDLQTLFRLLKNDPGSMQLNLLCQKQIGKLAPAMRQTAEKQYLQLAEDFPNAWIMQTFAAEILIRNNKTVQTGITKLFRVFQHVYLQKDAVLPLDPKETETFGQNLLSRLVLLTFIHKREDEYCSISRFLRKHPDCRKINLLTDWLLTSSGRREETGPLLVLPGGGAIPGKALTALQDFYICQQEILQQTAKGNLPVFHRCKILLNVFTRQKRTAELEQALHSYLKNTKKEHLKAYILLGDLVAGTSKSDLQKKASLYQKAMDCGLTVRDRRVWLLAGMYLELQELNKAEKLLALISKKAPQVNTLFHYITLYNAKKQYKQALKKIKQIRDPFLRYQHETFTRSFMGDDRGALKAADKVWAIAARKKYKFRNNAFLYLTVNLAEKCGDIGKVKAYLESAIKRNPGDMDLKNTLAYILADHNTDLEKAYSLLKEVVAAKPDVGAYLDSMAWVLYRMKRYQEAKDYILSAMKYHKDRVILDHAGDIFYALGDYKSAAAYWRQALQVNGEVAPAVIQKKLKQLNMQKGGK